MKKNKIKIYQCFLYQRLIFIIGFVYLLINIDISDIKNFFANFGIGDLIFWLLFFLLATCIPFFNYICLNKKENIIIFRQLFKKKVVIPLDKIKRLFLNINPIDEKDFVIDVVCNDEIKKIDDWSNPMNDASLSYLLKVTSRHQRKRLQKFIDQCNEYLETYQHKITLENQKEMNSDNK